MTLKSSETNNQAARRERRHSPTSDSHSTEDGEISKYDTYRRSDFPSPPPKAKEKKDSDGDKVDLDATAPNHQELNSARVSRYEIVDMMYKDGFEDVITGEADSCSPGPPANERLICPPHGERARPDGSPEVSSAQSCV